jgi:hypothetical protein
MATKNEISLEPPPPDGKFKAIDQNFLHIVIDEKDSESFYHALSVGKKVASDIRLSTYKFQIKLHSKADVFIPEYVEVNKKHLPEFEGKNILKPHFLEQLGTGDVVISSGKEKILKGLQEVVNQNDETFFYFGGTGKIENFQKEKIDFDLLSLPSEMLKLEDRDDDNIIPTNYFSVFDADLKILPTKEKKIEKDYVFLALPFLSNKRKQEIRVFKKTESSSFGLENLLPPLIKAYKDGYKIVILSNLIEIVDIETQLAFRKLIQAKCTEALHKKPEEIKIKFIHQDYIKSNKLLEEVFTHLHENKNDRIIFPSSHRSEIFSFLKGEINMENISWFKAAGESSHIFQKDFGIIDSEINANLERFSKFSPEVLETIKKYKDHVIHTDIISEYISEKIIELYTEDTKNKNKTEPQEDVSEAVENEEKEDLDLELNEEELEDELEEIEKEKTIQKEIASSNEIEEITEITEITEIISEEEIEIEINETIENEVEEFHALTLDELEGPDAPDAPDGPEIDIENLHFDKEESRADLNPKAEVKEVKELKVQPELSLNQAPKVSGGFAL